MADQLLGPQLIGAYARLDTGLRGDTIPDSGLFPSSLGARSMTAARAWLLRYAPPVARPLTLAAFSVTVAASVDDPFEIALYTPGSTFTRVATSGAVTGKLNALGLKTVSLAYTVDPTLVYYAVLVSATAGGTLATLGGALAASGETFTLFGATQPTALAGFADGILSGGLLPATFLNSAVSWGGLTTFPAVCLREV